MTMKTDFMVGFYVGQVRAMQRLYPQDEMLKTMLCQGEMYEVATGDPSVSMDHLLLSAESLCKAADTYCRATYPVPPMGERVKAMVWDTTKKGLTGFGKFMVGAVITGTVGAVVYTVKGS